jgi:gamma-glutamyltranspeptidase/glutathione hydrolase
MAVTCSYLLDSLLALSALHLAFLSKNEEYRPSWLQIGLEYENRAVTALNKVLQQEITPENYEPSFNCSALIIVFAAAYPGVSHDTGSRLFDPLDEVLGMRKLMVGPQVLFFHKDQGGNELELKGWRGARRGGNAKVKLDLVSACQKW